MTNYDRLFSLTDQELVYTLHCDGCDDYISTFNKVIGDCPEAVAREAERLGWRVINHQPHCSRCVKVIQENDRLKAES